LIHPLEAFRVTGDWSKARIHVLSPILKTASIAFIGFLVAYFTLPIKMTQEVAIISAINIVNLVVISFFLLPVLHTLLSKWDKEVDLPNWCNLELALNRLAQFCAKISQKLDRKSVIAILFGLGTLIIIFSSRVSIGGKPIEYVKDTSVWESSQFLNQENHPGSTMFDFLIEPANDYKITSEYGEVTFDSAFTNSVWNFTQSVEEIDGVRTVNSINHSIARISEPGYGMKFPDSNSLLATTHLFYINNIDEGVRKQSFDPLIGYRVSVSTSDNSSSIWHEICQKIITIAENYPEIKVSGFGNTFMYAKVPRYILNGTLWNILGDALVIFVVYALCSSFIFWRKRKLSVGYAIKMGVMATIPFLFASECLMVIMIIFKIPLDISTALIAPCALAAAIDFSIYFLDKFQELSLKGLNSQEALIQTTEKEGRIVLADCVSNQSLFSPLLTSGFSPVRQLGQMLVGMLFFSAIGALIIMPPLLRQRN